MPQLDIDALTAALTAVNEQEASISDLAKAKGNDYLIKVLIEVRDELGGLRQEVKEMRSQAPRKLSQLQITYAADLLSWKSELNMLIDKSIHQLSYTTKLLQTATKPWRP